MTRVRWNQLSTGEGPMRPPLGKPGVVCSLSAPLIPALEAGAHHPTYKPLLSSKQVIQLHAKELAWETARSQMLGRDEDWDPVQGQETGNLDLTGAEVRREPRLAGISTDSRFLVLLCPKA